MLCFEYVYSFAPMRPPRVSVTTFTSYICHIYAPKFGQYWTSFCIGNSSVSGTPYIWFLFVRPRLCLRLPSDSTSRWTPLPLANSSYCQVCSGLSPPNDSACRAHNRLHWHCPQCQCISIQWPNGNTHGKLFSPNFRISLYFIVEMCYNFY